MTLSRVVVTLFDYCKRTAIFHVYIDIIIIISKNGDFREEKTAAAAYEKTIQIRVYVIKRYLIDSRVILF